MSTNSHDRRLDALAAIIRERRESEYDRIPTRCLFTVELHQAAANYDNVDAATVAGRVAEVERWIQAVDDVRRSAGTDIIGAAMAKHAHTPDHRYTPDAVAASVVGACFHHDAQQHGESYAWAHQRKREHIAGIVRARMDGDRDVAIVGTAEQRAWLKTLAVDDLETLADVTEHIERTGTRDGIDVAVLSRYDDLTEQWLRWQEGHRA